MTKTKSTKRALLMSALALITCVSMLVGSTFAWFTDSVSSKGNKIVAGTLDISLYQVEPDLEGFIAGTNPNPVKETEITDSSDPLFGSDILWEPGYEAVTSLKLVNDGSLALKWKAVLRTTETISKLANVIDVYVLDNGEMINPDLGRDYYDDDMVKVGTLAEVLGGTTIMEGALEKTGDTAFFSILLKMQEEAGNEYQGLTAGSFDVTILATQHTYESDSFGKDYDELAAYPFNAYGELKDGDSAVELEIRDTLDTKVGSAVIPADAVDPAAEKLEVNIEKSNYKANISVAAGSEKTAFDVTVTGLKENNTVPVKVALRIAAGLDPDTVKLYHYEQEIDSSYNPETGYVTFESATFSPFTVVYDAESVYVPPVADDEKLPHATVVESAEYENVDLPWGSYGQWSPTEGLEANLEAAYTFSCNETLEQAKENPYANWYCDFYVKLDQDLGENEIFLGGNYGSFGWVGFHNGNLTLEANTEIPLLGSVTTNPWTYLDVVQNVGTFICGVGDVNDALEGATFTVMLRLTNPDNAEDFVNVATIDYKF